MNQPATDEKNRNTSYLIGLSNYADLRSIYLALPIKMFPIVIKCSNNTKLVSLLGTNLRGLWDNFYLKLVIQSRKVKKML